MIAHDWLLPMVAGHEPSPLRCGNKATQAESATATGVNVVMADVMGGSFSRPEELMTCSMRDL